MWTEENDQALDGFIHNPSLTTLVVYLDPFAGLKVEYAVPAQPTDQICYFIRREGAPLTEELFESTVQFGTARGGHTESLLRLMNGVYAPQVFSSSAWPESIRNNFSAHMHRFLASLTDARFKLEGHTVLYIPMEALRLKPEVAAKDKELVQRLESECRDLCFPQRSGQAGAGQES
ncbi:DYH2 protein, partial [Atractosteus spatula]|nr:DYH2 protein [Atractosteus spatula]